MIRRLVLVFALVGASVLTANPGQAVIPPDTHCRNGAVALTFDDGPHKTNTPRLLRVLRKNHAQATFFVQGQNVQRYPYLLKAMVRDGHAVENHSWNHPQLTHLSDQQIARQITHTTAVIRKYAAVTPRFMRPPFGDTDVRVRKAITKQHLMQELWTIDTNDWRGGSSTAIGNAALRGLRKHKSNVILMHDAVTNSPQTIKAVPAIIAGLRKKGYCLVPLQVTAKYSTLRGVPLVVGEGTTTSKLVTVRFPLDMASQRAASFHVRTVDGSAIAGTDYDATNRRMAIPRGAHGVSLRVRIFSDQMSNADKTFRLLLDLPRNLYLASRSLTITITDNGQGEFSAHQLMARR